MPNLPISQLPVADTLNGEELIPLVQNGITKYSPLQSTVYIPTNSYGLFNQTGTSVPVLGSTGTRFSGSLLDGGVGTLSVPANTFRRGDAFVASLTGKITATNNHNLEIHIKSDSVILVDTGVITLSGTTNRNWRLDINFSINETGVAGVASIATAGTFQYRKDAGSELIGEIFSLVNDTTFDTTIDNTLVIEAIWGTTSTNTDSIYSQIFTLYKIY